jgi:hypothetical protein
MDGLGRGACLTLPHLRGNAKSGSSTPKPAKLVAVRVAIDLGLFEYLAEGKGTAKSKDEIVSKVGGEVKLIGKQSILQRLHIRESELIRRS